MKFGGRAHWLFVLSYLSLAIAACSKSSPPSISGRVTVPTDVKLAYEVVGSGPDTVVMLNGGVGLHHAYLSDLARALAPGHAIILYDQRARGQSDAAPDSTLSMATDLRDLDALRDHFHLNRVSLFGHHWGAVLAALYAKQHPDRVNRLVLVSPPPLRSRQVYAVSASYPHDPAQNAAYLAATQARQDSTAPLEFCRKFWGFSFSPTEVTDAKLIRRLAPSMCDLPADAFRRGERVGDLVRVSLANYDMTDTLKALAIPVLVVEGEGPDMVMLTARSWASSLTNGRELTLPAPSLFPWTGDYDGFVRASREFLGGGWPAGSLDPAHAFAQTTAGKS
jgi:proline iminopeptidase